MCIPNKKPGRRWQARSWAVTGQRISRYPDLVLPASRPAGNIHLLFKPLCPWSLVTAVTTNGDTGPHQFTMTMWTDLNYNNKKIFPGISAEVCLNTTRSSLRTSDDIVLMLRDIVLVLWQHVYVLCGRLAHLPLGQRVVSLEHGFSERHWTSWH